MMHPVEYQPQNVKPINSKKDNVTRRKKITSERDIPVGKKLILKQ
jgi:hypothetical protein